jgi:hypothetical protein
MERFSSSSSKCVRTRGLMVVQSKNTKIIVTWNWKGIKRKCPSCYIRCVRPPRALNAERRAPLILVGSGGTFRADAARADKDSRRPTGLRMPGVAVRGAVSVAGFGNAFRSGETGQGIGRLTCRAYSAESVTRVGRVIGILSERAGRSPTDSHNRRIIAPPRSSELGNLLGGRGVDSRQDNESSRNKMDRQEHGVD